MTLKKLRLFDVAYERYKNDVKILDLVRLNVWKRKMGFGRHDKPLISTESSKEVVC